MLSVRLKIFIGLLMASIALIAIVVHMWGLRPRLAWAWLRAPEWTESAVPDEYFKRDSAAGVYRFFSTRGFADNIHEVGTVTYMRCYSDSVEIYPIAGTSDFIENEQIRVTNMKASAFAVEYNRKMRAFVDANGLSKCPPHADWEAATNELYKYISGDESSGSFSIHVEEAPPRLAIDLKDKSRADRIRKKTCSLLARNGVNEKVKIDVKHWIITSTPGYHSVPIGAFECAKGTASPLVLAAAN